MRVWFCWRMKNPRAPSYLNSRLLGYATIGYVEPSSHDLGIWEPLGLACYFAENHGSACSLICSACRGAQLVLVPRCPKGSYASDERISNFGLQYSLCLLAVEELR